MCTVFNDPHVSKSKPMNPIWLILSVMNPEFRIEFDEPTVACIESNALISALIILMLSASSNASKIICINSDLILSTFISKYENRSQIVLYTFRQSFRRFIIKQFYDSAFWNCIQKLQNIYWKYTYVLQISSKYLNNRLFLLFAISIGNNRKD